MGEIVWTEESAHWLRDIHDYIAPDSPEAAQKVVTGIYERAQILAKFPKIGHLYRVEPEGEIRILLYGHYRIAYLLGKNRRVDIQSNQPGREEPGSVFCKRIGAAGYLERWSTPSAYCEMITCKAKPSW
jgi:toxin ParE1/3/4